MLYHADIKHESAARDLKNDPTEEFIDEMISKINVVEAEKIKAKVYVNEHNFLSHIKPPARQ